MEEAEKRAERKREKNRLRRRKRRDKKRVVIAPSSLLIEVIEEIFLRLPIKVLMRLKTLSKQWRSTIQSLSFGERHLKTTERSRVDHPKVMVITEEDAFTVLRAQGIGTRSDTDIGFNTICLETASRLSLTRIIFPQGFFHWNYASQCCDGLFSIHSPKYHSIYVVNPATRWFRQLPPARFQILLHKYNPTTEHWRDDIHSVFHLAFVKANDYKLVWLYNSEKYNAEASSPHEGVTKCEVFDFRANAWRYLSCTPSYRIYHAQKPACANGSVYWLTEPYNGEIKVVSFNIHTEKFRLLPKIKPAIANSDPSHIDMCSLDNALCMSKRERDTMIQEIWRLKSSDDSWEKIYTIDLLSCSSSQSEFSDGFDWTRRDLVYPSTPVAICKNKEMLLSNRYARNLVKYDPQTKSISLVFEHPLSRRYVPYFQSLISHI